MGLSKIETNMKNKETIDDILKSSDFNRISQLKNIIGIKYKTLELEKQRQKYDTLCTRLAKRFCCGVDYKIRATYYEGEDISVCVYIDIDKSYKYVVYDYVGDDMRLYGNFNCNLIFKGDTVYAPFESDEDLYKI